MKEICDMGTFNHGLHRLTDEEQLKQRERGTRIIYETVPKWPRDHPGIHMPPSSGEMALGVCPDAFNLYLLAKGMSISPDFK